MKNTYLLILAAALLTSLIWGATPFLAKKVLKLNSDVEIFLLFTSIISFFLFLIIIAVKHQSNTILALNKFIFGIDWFVFIIWVVLAYMAAPFLFYNLLNTDTITFAIVLLTSLMPVFTALLGHMFFGEKITSMYFVGLVLVVAGLVIIEMQHLNDK